NTFNVGRRLRFFALVDFKTGHTAVSNAEIVRCSGLAGQGVGFCRANYFPKEYDSLYVAEATTAAVAGNYLDQYFSSASFAKLRELSATYNLPENWVRGTQTSFTLAAREFGTWTKFRGIDPEAIVGINDQAVTPPLSRLIATFNIKW